MKDISVFHPRVDTCLYHRDAIKENRTTAKYLHNIKLHDSVIIKTGNLGVVLERHHAEAVKKTVCMSKLSQTEMKCFGNVTILLT